jgi:hypothetical protein
MMTGLYHMGSMSSSVDETHGVARYKLSENMKKGSGKA